MCSVSMGLAALLFLAGASMPGARPMQAGVGTQVPTVSVSVTAAPAASAPADQPPGLVVVVLDRSGSMQGGLWDTTINDLLVNRLPGALRAAGASGFDLRLYPFSDASAEYASPAPKQFAVRKGDLSEVSAFVRDRSKRGLGEPYGYTALYGSVKQVAQGLLASRAIERYQWIYLLIYSDGDDTKTATDKADMCEALESLTRDSRVSVERVQVVAVKDLGCKGVVERKLGGPPKLPQVFSLGLAPKVIGLGKAIPGARLPIDLKLSLPTGIPGSDVNFTLVGAPAGVLLEPSGGCGELVCGQALPDGGRFRVQVRVRLPDGAFLEDSFELVVPPLDPIPPPSKWGLPSGCIGPDGLAYVMVSKAAGTTSPSALEVLVPDVNVYWWVGGKPLAPSRTLEFADWNPGIHDVEVQIVSLQGVASRRERLKVCVIDANVEVTVRSSLGNGQVQAGDQFRLEAEVPRGLPPFLAEELAEARGCWFVGGVKVESARGLSCDAPGVMDAGTTTAEFLWSSSRCSGQALSLRGRGEFKVLPGASIRVLTDRVTEGKNAVIEIAVEQPGQVHEVRVMLPESGASAVAVRPASDNEPWRATFEPPDFLRAARPRGTQTEVRVEAMPILKDGSSGLPTAEDYPGNRSRRVARTVALASPDVGILLCEDDGVTPLPVGRRVTLGSDLALVAVVTGIDRADVATLQLTSSAEGWTGSPKAADCARDGAGNPKPLPFVLETPPANQASSKTLEIVAQAFGRDGKALGSPVKLEQSLRPGRIVWAWVLVVAGYLGACFVALRLTCFNSRLGQEYRWSKDREGHDLFFGGTVGLFGDIRLHPWTKTMTVDVPVSQLPAPESDHKWLVQMEERLGGSIRFTIDREDNTEGDGYQLPISRFDPAPEAVGFVLRPPPAAPGKLPSHPLVLNFYHQKGRGIQFAVKLLGFVFVVGALAALVWLFWQDWF